MPFKLISYANIFGWNLIHSLYVVYSEMQASGLKGPISSSISSLNNMTNLWVLSSTFSIIYCKFQIIFILLFIYVGISLLKRPVFLLISWYHLCRAISDLSGESSDLPNLSKMKDLQKLWAISKALVFFMIRIIYAHYISQLFFLYWVASNCRSLRSCNITGTIPEYFSNMKSLRHL